MVVGDSSTLSQDEAKVRDVVVDVVAVVLLLVDSIMVSLTFIIYIVLVLLGTST